MFPGARELPQTDGIDVIAAGQVVRHRLQLLIKRRQLRVEFTSVRDNRSCYPFHFQDGGLHALNAFMVIRMTMVRIQVNDVTFRNLFRTHPAAHNTLFASEFVQHSTFADIVRLTMTENKCLEMQCISCISDMRMKAHTHVRHFRCGNDAI